MILTLTSFSVVTWLVCKCGQDKLPAVSFAPDQSATPRPTHLCQRALSAGYHTKVSVFAVVALFPPWRHRAFFFLLGRAPRARAWNQTQ